MAAFVLGPSFAQAGPDATEITSSLNTISQIRKSGEGHPAAVAAWKTLGAADADQLPLILSNMDDSNPLANNWIRAAVDTIAERTLASGAGLPKSELETYLADRQRSPRSRRLAFEWLVKADPTTTARWIPKLLDDPSLELRREAVADRLAAGAAAKKADNEAAAIEAYQSAFTNARDIDQINAAADALKDLQQSVDLVAHFGFITEWMLCGPFDNRDSIGFDQVYPPEQAVALDAEYTGMDQLVRWTVGKTEDDYGIVNLNDLLGKHKGAAAYAVAFFNAAQTVDVEFRLGCINANKIWLNGKLLTANHVYHSGDAIDQYVGHGTLQKGRNTILLKICQNEQEEAWAQEWQFQLRVCDSLGTAVLSTQP